MVRAIFYSLLFTLAIIGGYLLFYTIMYRKYQLAHQADKIRQLKKVSTYLLIATITMALGFMVYGAFFAESGTYRPARVVDGKLERGAFSKE
jgi:hypothetical protein